MRSWERKLFTGKYVNKEAKTSTPESEESYKNSSLMDVKTDFLFMEIGHLR
jgi:hypothetical protein